MLSLLVFPALMAAASLPFSSAIPHPLRPSSASQHRGLATRQDSGTGYAQPESWLTVIPNSNLGEPINVVISSQSDQAVLSDTGLQSYFSSLFFSPNNCLGISLGDEQAANLNDGQGVVNQTALYRCEYACVFSKVTNLMLTSRSRPPFSQTTLAPARSLAKRVSTAASTFGE